jgi:hypothetical protein
MALLEARFMPRLKASKVAFPAFFGFSKPEFPETVSGKKNQK